MDKATGSIASIIFKNITISSPDLAMICDTPFKNARNFHAAKNARTATVADSTSDWFSEIQSENLSNALTSFFNAAIITLPLHSPNGCKKVFQNHSAVGANVSITEYKRSRDAAISSKTSGNPCSRPHFVIGSKTLFKNHKSKLPIARTTDTSTLSKDSRSGEKSKLADQSLMLSDASRKNPDNVTRISPRCRSMFVPVSPEAHALSNCVIRFATVCTKLANVISKLSVIAFP